MTSRFPVLQTVLAGVALGSLTTLWWLLPSPYLARVLAPYALGLSGAWTLWCLWRLDRCVAQWRAWFVSPAWDIPVASCPSLRGWRWAKAFPGRVTTRRCLNWRFCTMGHCRPRRVAGGGCPRCMRWGLRRKRVVVLPWSEMVGHVGILGTTRSGKTSLLKAVTAQVIGE